MIALLRTLLFLPVALVITGVASTIVLLSVVLPIRMRFVPVAMWYTLFLALSRIIMGLGYRVIGRENIPKTACVVLSKHQSAWETIALQQVFPPAVFVLKKSLLWIPLFGWALAAIRMVSIDRKARKEALREVVRQGEALLREGISVVIFPEGTRTAPGTTCRFKSGGALLAVSAGAIVVPVAHNAGEFWGRSGFAKRAGEITVSVGPPIDARGKSAEEVTRLAEAWVEAEMQRIERGEV